MQDQNQPLNLEQVKRASNRYAGRYRHAAAVQNEIGLRLLDRLDLLTRPPEVTLDLGCGPASHTLQLADRFPKTRLIAADHSRKMLALAPGKLNWRRPLSRIVADAHQLPLADASVDLVFANQLLPSCPDPDRLFDEMRRILRPGGLFLFSTLGPDTLIELRQSWSEIDQAPHVHPFLDMHHLGDGLLASGFSDPVLDVEHLTATYSDIHQLFDDLRHSGSGNALMLRRKTLTGKNRLKELAQAYSVHQTPDGRLPATCEVIYGHAWGPKDGQPRRTPDGHIATFSVDQLRGSRRQR